MSRESELLSISGGNIVCFFFFFFNNAQTQGPALGSQDLLAE